jgi:hypothetical protein
LQHLVHLVEEAEVILEPGLNDLFDLVVSGDEDGIHPVHAILYGLGFQALLVNTLLPELVKVLESLGSFKGIHTRILIQQKSKGSKA